MIQWDTLKNNLQKYFDDGKNDKNRTSVITATEILAIYAYEIYTNAVDPYGNSVVLINPLPLIATLLQGFEKSMLVKSGSAIILNTIGLTGLLQTWTGAIMGLKKPPPGTISVVTNVIITPGTVMPMNVSIESKLIDELIKGFKHHVSTITGICTAMVPTPVGSVPTPFPWVGIN